MAVSPQLLTEKDGGQHVAAALTDGNNALLDGVCGSSCALAAASLASLSNFDSHLVVVADEKQTESMAADLEVFTDMGDGDCVSIGAGHWVHAVRYNLDITVPMGMLSVSAMSLRSASPVVSLSAINTITS